MYERFFGLVDAPFRLTPDPRYLFLSRKHAEALAHLRLGLTESSGFVCITGDVGTGKTTLLRAFLADLGPEVSTAYIFNPAVSPLELVRRINRELGLAATSDSQEELTEALNAHLLAQRRAGRLSVVVVDEAQAFSIELLEQLRLLSNLETATEKLLRVILVGQPQLRALLLDPALAQLNQRITLRWHMGPLDHQQTTAYVRHRLGVASRGKVTRVFTRPALRVLYRLSGGVPRLINMIAHRAMLAAFVARRRSVTTRSVMRAYREIEAVPLPRKPSAVRRVAWAASALLALGVGVLTVGVPRFGAWPTLLLPAASPGGAIAHTPATAAQPAAVAAQATSVRDMPAASRSEEAVTASATTPSVARASVPEAAAPPPAGTSAADLERRLAALDAPASARAALSTLLSAWHARPPVADEARLPDDLERVAWRRGLEHLTLMGNLSMLRLLDLPAVLELHAGVEGPRYATLTGMDDTRVILTIDGTPVTVDGSVLESVWFGEAHLFWRDFEGLGPTFGKEAHGAQVARLQALLRRANIYGGAASGEYDTATAAAVLDFQRSRRLEVDGRVGRFTRIVLYAATGGYPRPSLAPTAGAKS